MTLKPSFQFYLLPPPPMKPPLSHDPLKLFFQFYLLLPPDWPSKESMALLPPLDGPYKKSIALLPPPNWPSKESMADNLMRLLMPI